MSKLSKFYVAKIQNEKEIAIKQLEFQLEVQKVTSLDSLLKNTLSKLIPAATNRVNSMNLSGPFKSGLDLFKEIKKLIESFKNIRSQVKELRA